MRFRIPLNLFDFVPRFFFLPNDGPVLLLLLYSYAIQSHKETYDSKSIEYREKHEKICQDVYDLIEEHYLIAQILKYRHIIIIVF